MNATQRINKTKQMNPVTIASSFSIQKISKHHFLIRGDERVKEYMEFCDIKWSDSYQGWIVHEDDEVDLIQMHMEVLETMKENKKKKTTKKTKKQKKKKMSDYEKVKKGIEVSEDDDEDYVPSSSCTEEDEDDDYETEDEDEVEEEDSSSESESDNEKKATKDKKKEYQFYKKGILAFGEMTKKQKSKLDAIWNKHLGGYILRKSDQDRLEKYGWKEVGAPEEKKERRFEYYKNVLLICEENLTEKEESDLDAIYNPALKGYIVTKNYLPKVLELGFKEVQQDIKLEPRKKKEVKKEPEVSPIRKQPEVSPSKKMKEPEAPINKTNELELVKVDFSETKKLDIKTIE